MNRTFEKACYRLRASATFVCVSEGVAEEMRRYYPALETVTRIHNGVDTHAFAPGLRTEDAARMRVRLDIPPDRLVALFIGSEWQGKGLPQLLSAIAQTDRWELIVAGRGDRDAYESLTRELAIADRVHWVGVTRDVQLLYALADAFVLPSEYETFSLVTFEAAASGVPILATPVSGVRELVQDGRNGFIITQEPLNIAERLERLAADEELRTRLGHAAREAALHFSWERTVQSHHELYQRLAQGR
jgi:UDP-glucose:(heptosyl)LPS alpha-1,3-glucosyltransferase